MNTKKLKILISCYACSPNRGSEPGMGWHFVSELSKFHEVHVIVEKLKWKKDILNYLNKNNNQNLHFYFIKKNRNKTLRKIWPPSYYWFYKSWQKKAFNLAKSLDKKEHFNIVHQLNMVGYREPGYLWKMKKPFVWGPIGGTENVPWQLFSLFSWYGKLFYGGRNIINSFQKKFSARPKQAAKTNNAALIAATPNVKSSILKLWKKEATIITEVGIIKTIKTQENKRTPNTTLKIVWSGQHTEGKALPILLKSISLLNNEVKWSLDILGIGKETKKWQKQAKKLTINKYCNWYGWLEKHQAIDVMQNAHVLCITSLKDLTSTVTLEAISLGLPIICLNHCGFSYVVNTSCGIKIKPSKPSEIYKAFKNALELLYFNENYRRQLSKGALKRAKQFSWEEKIKKLNAIYNTLLK